ncbi:hypothetical protein GCM10027569_85230 [Flindersiella endophytica]
MSRGDEPTVLVGHAPAEAAGSARVGPRQSVAGLVGRRTLFRMGPCCGDELARRRSLGAADLVLSPIWY